ncbi:Telomerase protein component 1 [Tulasnella sp. JGI-2019a]|nr:Telomerase protein component 1 [Tulasnella sp. JGI-2019a]KAG9037311.1 Telomerase protein component 1 [Tulasnella sp. JGI-2019a]
MSIPALARRLVSGNKTRFQDEHLGVDLDLAYLTDRIIMMGYPASGITALYRNRADEAKTFLQHRHGNKYWVFNLCPTCENSYPSSLFEDRVSRYPFPDHHAPPMALLALATREMHAYLQGDEDRVVVLHCKAGKGRTGTLAVSYLLATQEIPTPPKLQRSYTSKEWAKLTADRAIESVLTESWDLTAFDGNLSHQKVENVQQSVPTSPSVEGVRLVKGEASTSQEFLEAALSLHTSRRMKPAQKGSSKPKQGVSIPSQRRFLEYWSIIVMAPRDIPREFWTIQPVAANDRPKVWLQEAYVRMRRPGGLAQTAVQVVNAAMGSAAKMRNNMKGNGQLSISLARYDDRLVEIMETWERRTRRDEMFKLTPTSHGNSANAKGDSDTESVKHEIFTSGAWDQGKMIKTFAKFGECNKQVLQADGANITLHSLRPYPLSSWVQVEIPADESGAEAEDRSASTMDMQGADGMKLETDGILLDSSREVRLKLYMGEVPFGWFWFIPAFEQNQSQQGPENTTILTFTRKELDFPLGPGSWLVDVELRLVSVEHQTGFLCCI